jgi:transcriptional regulator with PAS, ATPase and Fis domain
VTSHRPPDEATARRVGFPRVETHAVDVFVVDGPDRGQHVRITSGRLRVGSAETNDVRLRDPTVSRLHCELSFGDVVHVVDLGSTNGTWVNGVRVHDAELPAGCVLHVGGSALRIEMSEELAEVEVSPSNRFGQVIGESFEMRRIFAILERVAPTDAAILLEGETGTGKDALAQALHDASKRRDGPFVAVDCGAMVESLVESELFGHVRGAFTGANQARRGLLAEADGGTLFLDEIGELPLSLQPKFLRALETREVRPVGANSSTPFDVRVLAATNRPLAQSVNEGTFREDLFYRLAVIHVLIPPLRARRDDVGPLARLFWERFAGTIADFPEAILPALEMRSWPGNVRELRNHVERIVSLGTAEAIGRSQGAVPAPPVAPHDATAGAAPILPVDLPLREARLRWTEQFEALYLRALLERTHGNVTQAAELAGVNRRTFQRLMAQNRIRPGS